MWGRTAGRTRTRLGLVGAVMVAASVAASGVGAARPPARPPALTVMTRNVNLGADLELGVRASGVQGLVDAAGTILSQVDRNNFPVRARGLAAEILRARPDLVGLQEVALWRTGPCTESPIPPKAAHVRYDYLALLLKNLNRGARRYRVVIAQPEFDFEVPVNVDGNDQTAAPGCPLGSELNGRLTMRDVILARVGRVKTAHASGGHFTTLLQVRPGGLAVNVTRGWARVDASVPGGRTIRFVDTHLEAYDNQASNHTSTGHDVGNGQIRAAQARELIARGGPASGRLPVILVGDLNSDRRTAVKPGDALAYDALRHAGFVERSTSRPGCCLNGALLSVSGGARASDFNHRVDHVMTNDPRQIRLLRSWLTGTHPVHGYWDSDHAGLVSVLTLP